MTERAVNSSRQAFKQLSVEAQVFMHSLQWVLLHWPLLLWMKIVQLVPSKSIISSLRFDIFNVNFTTLLLGWPLAISSSQGQQHNGSSTQERVRPSPNKQIQRLQGMDRWRSPSQRIRFRWLLFKALRVLMEDLSRLPLLLLRRQRLHQPHQAALPWVQTRCLGHLPSAFCCNWIKAPFFFPNFNSLLLLE